VRRNGFTLVEVLVALTLSAVVVLLAHRVFAAVLDGTRQVRAAREHLDREANARRWLVDAFGSLAVGPVGGSFEGEPGRVTFGAWLPTETGGFTPERVDLSGRGARLVARLGASDSLVLADSVPSVAFDYLLEPGASERWVGEWVSPVSAPVAVRVRIARRQVDATAPATVDTLLLLIGPRG
jgi:prepilin-type N-terminal cleavage/methylation domain-containing protein